MLKFILIFIVIVTGGTVVPGPIRRFVGRHKLLNYTASAFAIASGFLVIIGIFEYADSFAYWIYRKVGPSEQEIVSATIRSCNKELDLRCIRNSGAFGADATLAQLKDCRNPLMIRSDEPSLNWKDIWTTSVYSFQPGGGGPGGGRDDDVLKVGGWGDWYFSLIKFDLPSLKSRPLFVALTLYSQDTQGASVPLMLDQLVHQWNFPKGGTLWWKDRPGQRAAIADPMPAPKREQWYVIDITTLFIDWSNKKIENYGLQIRPVHEFGSFVFFTSSDAADKSKIPRLIVCS